MLNFYRTYSLPFKYSIPNYILVHLQKVKFFSRFFKFFRRYLLLSLLGQKKLETFKILQTHKKILWINISAPSFGDSLMDLSSRILLKEKILDLYTDEKNANLYLDDIYFNNIYTNSKALNTNQYDLVIMDSYSSRTLKIKAKVAPKTHFVGMFGYFNGPEVNRILFSFHQMNSLLSYSMTEEEVINKSKNSLSISSKDKKIVKNIIPNKYIAIALGGEWKYKTYQKWKEVVSQLFLDDEDLNIIFVGSNNAQNVSNDLIESFPENKFLNFTSRLSFNQTAEVIRKSEVFLCCDGGLMHAATAMDSKIIGLLARLTPDMLLTKNTNLYSLYDKETVNNISSSAIISKYYEVSSFVDNHPQSE